MPHPVALALRPPIRDQALSDLDRPRLARLAEELPALCLDTEVPNHQDAPRIVNASCEIGASAERIFEFIADPTQQPRWDGNDNLVEATHGQRVRKLGDVFSRKPQGGTSERITSSSSKRVGVLHGSPPNPARSRQATCGGGSLSRSHHHERESPTPTTGLN